MTTTPLPPPTYPESSRNMVSKRGEIVKVVLRPALFTAEQVHQARADLEAENAKLKDLLGKANALARLRFERVRQLEGRAVNEDYSDCHGPDWTDRESEYLK